MQKHLNSKLFLSCVPKLSDVLLSRSSSRIVGEKDLRSVINNLNVVRELSLNVKAALRRVLGVWPGIIHPRLVCVLQIHFKSIGFGVVVGCFRVSRVQTPVTERRSALFGVLFQSFCVSADSSIILTSRELNFFRQQNLKCFQITKKIYSRMKPRCTVGSRIEHTEVKNFPSEFQVRSTFTCSRVLMFYVFTCFLMTVSLALTFIHKCWLNSRLRSSSFSFHFIFK